MEYKERKKIQKVRDAITIIVTELSKQITEVEYVQLPRIHNQLRFSQEYALIRLYALKDVTTHPTALVDINTSIKRLESDVSIDLSNPFKDKIEFILALLYKIENHIRINPTTLLASPSKAIIKEYATTTDVLTSIATYMRDNITSELAQEFDLKIIKLTQIKNNLYK